MAREIYKLQVELNMEQLAGLNELQDAGGLRTKKELLDNALTLLKWAVRQKRQGHLIISMNPETGAVRELEVPYLERVREMSATIKDVPAGEPVGTSNGSETSLRG